MKLQIYMDAYVYSGAKSVTDLLGRFLFLKGRDINA